MRKSLHVFLTVLIMGIADRFIIRIVDAAVQIDDDLLMLVFLLICVNALLLFLSIRLYRTAEKKRTHL